MTLLTINPEQEILTTPDSHDPTLGVVSIGGQYVASHRTKEYCEAVEEDLELVQACSIHLGGYTLTKNATLHHVESGNEIWLNALDEDGVKQQGVLLYDGIEAADTEVVLKAIERTITRLKVIG